MSYFSPCNVPVLQQCATQDHDLLSQAEHAVVRMGDFNHEPNEDTCKDTSSVAEGMRKSSIW